MKIFDSTENDKENDMRTNTNSQAKLTKLSSVNSIKSPSCRITKNSSSNLSHSLSPGIRRQPSEYISTGNNITKGSTQKADLFSFDFTNLDDETNVDKNSKKPSVTVKAGGGGASTSLYSPIKKKQSEEMDKLPILGSNNYSGLNNISPKKPQK